MKKTEDNFNSPRRGFLGTIAAGAAALGLATLATPIRLMAEKNNEELLPGNPDEWFNKIKGKHRIVFDVPAPHGIFPFVWPKVFLLTNQATGTAEKDTNVVVVLRHDAIGYAMEDRLWEKYNFGAMFKAEDPRTKAPATRNPFWQPKTGDYAVPGVGNVEIGIDQLQKNGVMFCVCDMALTVYSAAAAAGMKLDAAEVKKDWVAGLLPGIQVVPSGVWALGRAQQKGCGYIFAG